MKSSKEVKTGIARKPVLKDWDVYAKSQGRIGHTKELYKPLYKSMYS